MQNQLLEKQKEKARGIFDSLPLPNFKHGLNIHSALDFAFPFEHTRGAEFAPWKFTKQSGSIEIEDLSLASRRPEVARLMEEGKFLEAENKIDAWNLFSARTGQYVCFDGECAVDCDVEGAQERHDLVVLHAKPGSRVQVVIRYRGKPRRSVGALATERLLVVCEEGSSLSITSLDESGTSSIFRNRQARVMRDAAVAWNDFVHNAGFFSLRTSTELLGEGARVRQNVGYAGAGKEIADIDARIFHRAPRTDSDMRMRLAASGQARVVCQGTVVIDPAAPGSSGFQDIKGVAFDGAEIDPVPHLEIGNADVKCGHAVAVSPFEEETLFYLSSRGMSEADARKALLHSFYDYLLPKDRDSAAAKVGARFIKKSIKLI